MNKMREVGTTPDGVCYSMLLAACNCCTDADRERRLERQMYETDFVPITVCFDLVINVHARSGNVQETVRWLRRCAAQTCMWTA